MGALEPPPVVDPDLQNLTFDQLAQLVTEVSPDVFYQRAHAFDLIAARYEQVQDDLERETRNMWEAWSGRIAESFDELVRQVSGLTTAVLQAVWNPGYGVAMRRAGDALAQAQQRMRNLQAQNRRGDLEAARQVLADLGTAYSDSGAMMSPMPDAVTGLPATVGNRAIPKIVPSVEGQLVPSRQHHAAEGGDGRAGEAPGSVAFASLAGHQQIMSGVTRPSAVPSRTSGHEVIRVAPAVLGRDVSEASPKAGEQHGEQSGTEVAVVLGRSPRTGKPVVHAASMKPKKAGTERPGAAECDKNEQSRPDVAAEREVVTSSGPPHHDAHTGGPLPVTSTALAPTTGAQSHVVAAPTPPSPSPAAQTGDLAQLPGAGHIATAPPAGSASLPAVATHGSAATAGVLATERALPESAAFQPVAGHQDAEPGGTPPVLPGATGALRPSGEHPVTGGGFVGGMFRGQQGHDEHARERSPADFLGGEAGAWNSGGDGKPVLGRAANPPQPVSESELEDLEELKKIKDAEVLRLALGRMRQQREEGDR